MLDSNRKGYAVMNKELSAYGLKDSSLETCKEYCRNGDVIVEQIPYKIGYSIRICWRNFYKPFYFKYNQKNILWFHWNVNKEYSHKKGKIVYRSNN